MKKSEVLKMNDAQLDEVVKIQGTPYDRKRKLSEKALKKMSKMFIRGKTISEIANKFDLSYKTVQYNVDKEYKTIYNATRSGAHTGKDHITVQDRITYKRELVAAGKIKV